MTENTNIKTVAELMEFLKNFEPSTEIHIWDESIGWSLANVVFTERDGIWFEPR